MVENWKEKREPRISQVFPKIRKKSVVQPNRLNRDFQTNRPNQLYVTDMTYIACGQRFYYLSAVQDLYNNEIVAWKLSKRNDLELVMETVESLTAQRNV
nr:DDE-type integrase/transposase/recombinase [Bacillus atrophaeus]